MIGNSVIEWRHSQIDALVGNGKGTASKPNRPMVLAPRAQDPVRFGRALLMQGPLVFGLVAGVGRDW